MRTIEDLQAVFAELEAAAPLRLRDIETVLSPPRRRGRLLVALTAAAIVLAAVIAVLAWPRPAHHAVRPAGPPAAACPRNEHCPLLDSHGRPVPMPSHYSLGLRPDSGWTVLARSIDTRTEQMQVSHDGGQVVGVMHYGPFAMLPEIHTTSPVKVLGHDASYVALAEPAGPAIAWADGTGTTVVQQLDAGGADDAVLSAARAVIAVNEPIRLPFRFSSLPTGLVPESLSVVLGPDTGFADLGFTDGKPTQNLSDPPLDHGPAIEVTTALPDQRHHGKQVATADDGTPVYAVSWNPSAVLIGSQVVVSANAARVSADPPARLAELAAHISIAPNQAESATWFMSELFGH